MHSRYLAVDVFRGLTIVFMILVNSLDEHAQMSWLQHSVWNGCSIADLVFPFFLIVVGISIILKFNKPTDFAKTQIFKRTVTLFFYGLLLNAFPYFLKLDHLRIMGVLQRIAICYCLSALICINTSPKQQIYIITLILVLYWQLNVHLPTTYIGHLKPFCQQNLLGCLDKLILSSPHLYQANFDPEGILSTFPALATTLIGNLMGYCLLQIPSKRKLISIFTVMGAICCLIGYLWGIYYPINKLTWSSTYVLWTGGLAMWVFSCCVLCSEIKKDSLWIDALQLFGQHSLFIFIIHVIGLKLLYFIKINTKTNLHTFILNFLNKTVSSQYAAIVFAISYTLICLFILFWFPKKKEVIYKS